MRKGFTLIELLIVLAIIATLLSVTTPVALNAVKKAKATQIGRNIRNLIDAGEKYYYT
jgi:prepilin-type N-terminal cleavage/methylation domain-containing protein